jgi:type IV secretory pathway TrbL component
VVVALPDAVLLLGDGFVVDGFVVDGVWLGLAGAVVVGADVAGAGKTPAGEEVAVSVRWWLPPPQAASSRDIVARPARAAEGANRTGRCAAEGEGRELRMANMGASARTPDRNGPASPGRAKAAAG